jgi:ribonuclease HI
MSEGWERIVIITDSTYVADGATRLMAAWARRWWVTSKGKLEPNEDLWQRLSATLGEYARAGCEVSFWAVPRKFNGIADAAAKAAAEEETAKAAKAADEEEMAKAAADEKEMARCPGV